MKKLLWIALVVAALAAPSSALAFGFRLGGQFAVDPETDSKFAFGTDDDAEIFGPLNFNNGILFGFDGDGMVIDGLIGLKLKYEAVPNVLPSFKVCFLMKGVYIWEAPEGADTSGFALGPLFGPGIGYRLSNGREVFADVDIGIAKFVYPDAWSEQGKNVFLNLMLGFRF
jgi:hypothetical protein